MKSHTETEENYLKAIYRFSQTLENDDDSVTTNTLANYLGTSPASVTDMVKRLSEKELLRYVPYKGVRLTDKGEKIALRIVRKHRIWEVFLVEKLNFSWDNVHEVAEQLEHIDSAELIRRLDEYLGKPKFDPHGDPIPSENGEIQPRKTSLLSEVDAGSTVVVAGVQLSEPAFLKYLDKLGMNIGQKVTVVDSLPFDGSMELKVNGVTVVVSGNVSDNLLVLKA